MNIKNLTDVIWNAALPYFSQFHNLGIAIFSVLFGLELAKEALNLATGRGFNLDKKLLTYALVGLLIVGYIQIATGFKVVAQQIITSSESVSDEYWDTRVQVVTNNYELMDSDSWLANWWKGIVATTSRIFSGNTIIIGLVNLLQLISIMIFDVLIICYFIAFVMVLSLGQFFLVFLISEDFKSMAHTWISNVISYYIVFPLFVMGLKIATAIQKLNIEEAIERLQQGEAGFADLFPAILKSLISLGIAFLVPNVGRAVTGTFGGGESALAGLGVAMGLASKASGGTNVGQAATNVGNAAKATGRGAVKAAKATGRGVSKAASAVKSGASKAVNAVKGQKSKG